MKRIKLKKDTVITIVKVAGTIVIAIGIGAIVSNVIKVNTPSDVKKITRLCIGVSGLFLTGVLTEMAAKDFGETFDKGKTLAETIIKKFKDLKKENPEDEVIAEALHLVGEGVN